MLIEIAEVLRIMQKDFCTDLSVRMLVLIQSDSFGTKSENELRVAAEGCFYELLRDNVERQRS